MAKQCASVAAAFNPATDLAATVRQFCTGDRRVLEFSAKAEILSRQLLEDILTGWAPPSDLRFRAARPCNGALEVENVVAVLAGPRRLVRLDRFHAHQTLQAPLLDVAYEFLPLRQFLIIRRWRR